MLSPQETILVVEDESATAFLIQQALIVHGYDVPVVVRTGEAAVEQAGQIQPDLILMDINLAGEMDGISAAEEISRHFPTPIIYLTGATDDDTLQRAKSSEPLNYLIKPFRIQELSIIVDMTLHRQRMAQQLKAAEAQLRYKARLMKYMLDAFIVVDPAHIIQEWNPAAETLYRWPAEEAIGQLWEIVVPTTFSGTPLETVRSLILKNGFWQGEAIQWARDGRMIDVTISISAVADEGEQCAGYLLVNHDVTARKQAEAERTKLARALENTANIVYITDVNGRIEYTNQAFEQVTGYSRGK